ncbi:MAG: alkaline phosphatase D family protein [Myxococcales bacterium]|nr:alkaline phosphatase D family protein [Myxococcales bacterium]
MIPTLRIPSPAAPVVLLSIALAIGCGGDETTKKDAGNIDAGDGQALQCTSWLGTPNGESSPTEVAGAPNDGAVSTTFDPEGTKLDDKLFDLGVQSGEMKPESVVLWTHVSEEADLLLRVWRDDPAAGKVALVYDAAVMATAAGIVQVPVEGLAPATVYHYAFFEGTAEAIGSRSRIGRVRTAPMADTELKLRLGATTCVGSSSETDREKLLPFPALAAMGGEDLDFVVHMGDVSYNDGAETLADFRAAWARTLGVEGYKTLLGSTGMYATWDDHEVRDNCTDDGVPESVFKAARQTWDEFLPTTRKAEDPIWGSYTWGKTVEVIVMDLRTERDPDTMDTADATFVSQEQLDFVKKRLQETDAHFKLIMSSVNMTNLGPEGGWDTPLSLHDRWEGYGAQRTELLDHIVDNGIRNVWFLAGDIHMGFVGRIEPEDHEYGHMWEITVGPGASSANPLGALVVAELSAIEEFFPCRQFAFGHGYQEVETYLELDPGADTIRVTFKRTDTGDVLFDEIMRQEEPR